MTASQFILSSSLLSIALAAMVWDLKWRRIPNWLTFGAAGFGLFLHGVLADGSGLLFALEGWAVGLLVLLPGFLLRATGAGDVKLMAALGTLLGPYWILFAAVVSILCGSALALTVASSAAFRGVGVSPWPRYRGMLRCLATTGRVAYVRPAAGEIMARKLPFAVSIALGTALTLWWQWPMALAGAGG